MTLAFLQLTEHPLLQAAAASYAAEILSAVAIIGIFTALAMALLDRAPRARRWIGIGAAALLLATLLITLSGCFPMPAAPAPVAQDAAAECPCPELVLARGGILESGEDPDAPPPCSVATNCGRHVYIPARDLPRCQDEAARGGER